MLVLGVHDGHNASACLLEDGAIRYAIQEERLSRIKNHSGFPFLSINKIFELAKVSYHDLDYIAFSWTHLPKNLTREQLMHAYRQSCSTVTYMKRLVKRTPLMGLYKKVRKSQRIKMIRVNNFPEEKIRFIDHHLSHAATAYYGCPWGMEEKILVLTNDASGDGLCATVNIGEKGVLKRIAAVNDENSIGYIYSMATFFLGMVPEEHEYKLMGMAPYASSDKSRRAYEKFSELFCINSSEDRLTWSRRKGCPPTQYSLGFIEKNFAYERFDWLCRGLQDFLENFLVQWVRNCIKKTNIHRVALSGGVFMNVKANKRIMEMPEVESLFVVPSCGDESNSIGVAYHTFVREMQGRNMPVEVQPLGHLYLGPDFSDEQIEANLIEEKLNHEKRQNIENDIASLLKRGEVVARFKGPMEFGARALGNRAILADPSRIEVVRIINEMIKNRDFWMPFAPTILDKYADKYIINPKRIAAPYMILGFDSTDQVNDIKAATHPYDHSVRPQVLEEEWNPDYYNLIKQFERLTGRGAILNTSFNVHGFPIVCSPRDAIEVFRKSGLRYMAIGNFLVAKDSK